MIYLFATIGLCIYTYLHSISAGVCLNDKLYNNTYDYKTPLGAPLPILHITTMILIILSWSRAEISILNWGRGLPRPGPRSLGRGLHGPTSPYTHCQSVLRRQWVLLLLGRYQPIQRGFEIGMPRRELCKNGIDIGGGEGVNHVKRDWLEIFNVNCDLYLFFLRET